MTDQPERPPEHIGRIQATPGVLGGEPRIAGTRISTEAMYRLRKGGMTADDIIGPNYWPYLDRADVLAAISFEQGRRWKRGKVLE